MQVVELWRYPVKSLQGEQLSGVDVGTGGIEGDRRYGLLDQATGTVLTARREPRLLFASARLDGDGVCITLPDGSVARDDDALSEWLGRRVALRRCSPDSTATFEAQIDFEHEATAEWFA